MKKYFYLGLAVLICIGVTAALGFTYRALWGKPATSFSAEEAPPDVLFRIPSSPYYAPAAGKYGYDALTTEDQRTVYAAIVKRITSITNEPTGEKYTNSSGYFMQRIFAPRLNPRELAMVIDCVREDYPEAFWLTGNCRHGTDENGQYFIQLISYISPAELDNAISLFNGNVSGILQALPAGLDEFERELYVHDWLVENCQYDDKGYDSDKNDLYTGSAYGAFVGGQTICEGYARGFQLLLKMVGIESRLLTGSSFSPVDGNGRAHIWNMARIHGKWYQVDVTWDDSRDVDHRYDYFNLTTAKMLADHIFDPLYEETQADAEASEVYDYRYNRPYPNCVDTEMNYYVRMAVSVGDQTQDTLDHLTQRLVEACQKGQTSIPVYFSNPKTVEACRQWVTQSAFFLGARNANRILGRKALMENEVYYSKSATFDNVLIFQLPLAETAAA